MGLRLIIEDYDGETTVVPLNGDDSPITVGRQETNTIQLTEQNVSRKHARLRHESEHWVLEDLTSYNGIRVNGRILSDPLSLDDGDVFQIGDYRLILSSDAKNTDHYVHTQRTRVASDDTIIGHTQGAMAAEPTRNVTIEVNAIESRGSGAAPTMRVGIAEDVLAAPDVDDDFEPRKDSKRGVWIGVVALTIALLGFVGVLVLPSQGSKTPEVAAAERSDKGGEQTQAPPNIGHDAAAGTLGTPEHPTSAGQAAAEPPVTASPENSAESTQGGQLDQANPPAESEDAGDGPGDPRFAVDALNTAEEQDSSAAEDLSPETPERSQSRSNRSPAKARGELEAARGALLANDLSRAFRLAKASNDHHATPEALNIMGVAACRQHRRADAVFVYKRLRILFGSEPRVNGFRRDLEKVCSANGLEIAGGN